MPSVRVSQSPIDITQSLMDVSAVNITSYCDAVWPRQLLEYVVTRLLTFVCLPYVQPSAHPVGGNRSRFATLQHMECAAEAEYDMDQAEQRQFGGTAGSQVRCGPSYQAMGRRRSNQRRCMARRRKQCACDTSLDEGQTHPNRRG